MTVTTDRTDGLLLGPDSDSVFFQDPVPMSAGQLPQALWWTTNHTNELVPLRTRAPGSELFASLFDGVDPRRGQYIDNTDVYAVMSRVIPEPASIALLTPAAILFMRRRRA